MNEDQVMDVLENVGAFRKGHFVFTSGRHSDTYVNKDALFAHPRELSQLTKEFAQHFKDMQIDVVVGPAVAAAILAQWTAFHLSEMNNRTVYAGYADKDGNGGFIIKRGYDKLIRDKRVLVVEDLTTTGGSVKKVVEVARALGGNIIGAAVLCNRGNVKAVDVGNPDELFSLVTLSLESWDAAACDLCQHNIPVNVDIGHGREFMAKKAQAQS